jgi:hypothetical protein
VAKYVVTHRGQTEDVFRKFAAFPGETWSLCEGQLDRIEQVSSYGSRPGQSPRSHLEFSPGEPSVVSLGDLGARFVAPLCLFSRDQLKYDFVSLAVYIWRNNARRLLASLIS